MLPDETGLEGSVSTSPGAFKTKVESAEDERAMADRMLRHAAFLHDLASRTGKIISLAIEPEPACHLETVDETVAFFEQYLFSRRAVARMADLAGLSAEEAEAAVRRHLGVCFDTCHMAVSFEDPASAFQRFERAGIRIGKVQLSAGLELTSLSDSLRAFDDGVYLHQVVRRDAGGLTRYVDLADAFDAEGSESTDPLYRVHFHVPLFQEDLGAFVGTQSHLREVLAILRERSVTQHLEVETYTWDVLPEPFRKATIVEAVSRELTWVMGHMNRR